MNFEEYLMLFWRQWTFYLYNETYDYNLRQNSSFIQFQWDVIFNIGKIAFMTFIRFPLTDIKTVAGIIKWNNISQIFILCCHAFVLHFQLSNILTRKISKCHKLFMKGYFPLRQIYNFHYWPRFLFNIFRFHNLWSK